MGTDLLAGTVAKGKRGNGFKPKEAQLGLYKRSVFYNEGDETLEQAAQRGGTCPIPGNIQGQVDRTLSSLVEDVPAHCTGAGADEF